MFKRIIFLMLFIFMLASAKAYAADRATLKLIFGGGGANPGNKPSQQCLDNPAKCLKIDFNFVVHGNPSKAILQDIYKIYFEVGSEYPKYQQLLKTSGPTDLKFMSTGEGGCPAMVEPNYNGTSTMTLRSYSLYCARDSERKSRLVHESSHVIRNGYMRLFDQFENNIYNKDKNCYKYFAGGSPPYFFYSYDPSYAVSIGKHPSGSNESMAEYVADHIVSQGSKSCPIGERWVTQNIFGH